MINWISVTIFCSSNLEVRPRSAVLMSNGSSLSSEHRCLYALGFISSVFIVDVVSHPGTAANHELQNMANGAVYGKYGSGKTSGKNI